jgi:ferredoxin
MGFVKLNQTRLVLAVNGIGSTSPLSGADTQERVIGLDGKTLGSRRKVNTSMGLALRRSSILVAHATEGVDTEFGITGLVRCCSCLVIIVPGTAQVVEIKEVIPGRA